MKILGLDLGSNSIGATIRDTDLAENQIERYAVTIFKTGVGKEKGVEYSFAATRTQKRSIRRLYQSRKYRLWATLETLIAEKMCPLTIDELYLWKKNIKGKTRQYPIIKKFEDWIKLDFNKDSFPDYTSPYQLRKEIVEKQLNLALEIDRFKLGRALYHIAQRRGFKSSKGETAKEQEKELEYENLEELSNSTESEVVSLKKSEQKKAGKLHEYIELRQQEGVTLKTIGAAFADIEDKGERVREIWLQHTIRQHYEEEIKFIFEFQTALSVESNTYKKIIKAIFYKRPLRSQKGLVGKCTLEKYIYYDKKTGGGIEVSKPRCPISHPEFEEFRAWSFINNIRFQKQNHPEQEDWQELDKDLKNRIFDRLFIRVKKNFQFDEIAAFINKEKGESLRYNFKNRTNVSGNPVTARLRNLLGHEWKEWSKASDKTRKGKLDKNHVVTYSWESIWHIWFSFQDEELVEKYAQALFQFDNSKIKQFITGWASLPVGYSMLSIKAIKNINAFLRQGFIYTEAVLLGKIPEVLGNEIWVSKKEDIVNAVKTVVSSNRLDKSIYNITNTLISKYKALDFKDKFAHKDTSYVLDNTDTQTIEKSAIETYGERGFSKLSSDCQLEIKERVKELYQLFFKSTKRDYYKLPKVTESIIQFLKDNFTEIKEKELEKLYHPSLIEFYAPVTNQEITDGYQYFQLPSPKIGSFKNPMAMRALYELRKLINHFLRKGYIDEETRIVIELARELNDSNKRWAIEAYQRQREAENKEFENAIIELLKDKDFDGIVNSENSEDIDKLRLLTEHSEIKNEIKDIPSIEKKKNTKLKDRKIEDYLYKSSEFIKKLISEKDLIKKYRLWKEQQFHCIYTGKPIKVTDLFNNNVIDFEHTIPRSISFDNTLSNLTVCYSDFNRTIKRKKIPTQLDNYSEILKRIKAWEEKVEQIKENIEFWKKKSKGAATKEFKDKAIRQKHLWQMEFEYWQNKVDRFKMEEVSSGFKNRQLVDTQMISKYAFHYLKTVFQRVDVQKGIITSEFRKIFDLQEKGKEKDRSKHSHHAKDAAVLTLIPTAVKRDEILTKAWDFNEKTNKQFREKPYPAFERKFIEAIDEDILVNNVTNDQALSKGKKYDRKRGRVVFLKDENGNDLLDNNQQKIKKIKQGDSIRGQLHAETFLGANRVPKKDSNGNWYKDENGKIVFEKDLLFVKREPFVFKLNAQTPGFTSLKDLENKLVDKGLYNFIEKKIKQAEATGKEFKDILNEGIWHKGKNGLQTRIRHVRIKTSAKDPLVIKRQTHISKKPLVNLETREHKKFYYAANGENYVFALYQGLIKNKIERGFKLYGLFDVAGMASTDGKLIIPEAKEIKKGIEIPLLALLKHGQKVLFYQDTEENMKRLSQKELSKRLYRIFAFEQESEGKGRISLQHHLETGVPNKSDGESALNLQTPHPILRISKDNFKFLIEGKDFTCEPDGTITWK